MQTSKQFKVAAVQAVPAFLDLRAGVAKAIDLIEQAARQGCKLVVFSETWLPGYPNQIWLGAPAWSMQFFGRYFENSLQAGGPEDQAIADAARRNNIQASMGLSERDGGSLYIAQWHYAETGEVIKRRRKLKPTHVERTVFGEGDGSDLAVCETSIGRVGQLACWEHLQPLSKYAMYSQNEQIHCAAWPNLSAVSDEAYAYGPTVSGGASMIYAVEGGCFVIAACAVVGEEQQAMLCQGDPMKEAMCPTGGGFARIFAPDGRSIGANLDPHEEGLVMAEIDLDLIPFAKASADPAGHYSRPDVTRLLFNNRPARRVEYFASPLESAPPAAPVRAASAAAAEDA